MRKLAETARDEQICLALEHGTPAWQIARDFDLSGSPLVYHIYRRVRGKTFEQYKKEQANVTEATPIPTGE